MNKDKFIEYRQTYRKWNNLGQTPIIGGIFSVIGYFSTPCPCCAGFVVKDERLADSLIYDDEEAWKIYKDSRKKLK